MELAESSIPHESCKIRLVRGKAEIYSMPKRQSEEQPGTLTLGGMPREGMKYPDTGLLLLCYIQRLSTFHSCCNINAGCTG